HKRPSPPPKAKQPPPQQKLKPSPAEHEAAQSPSSSGITFLPAEIKGMLARAEKLSGDGNYNGAIAVYDAVLRADRHNGPASEGRQRAIYNRDHR
ncbi:MAG TPA: hypothetical protein VFC39_09860, partial [Acidobacteriaceae bacterium]|nr:hypothetical protein [Acidobacteriaceae bacterium]